MTPRRAGIALILVLASLPRILWFRAHQPDLPPDAYGYLNLAREWRGQRAPAGLWDDRSQMPADTLGARTPGYAWFLNAVFAAAGHSPTPDASLAGPRRVLRPATGTGSRDVHWKHLTTDENVRAVQAAQHVIGVLAAVAAFAAVLNWTGSVVTAIAASLVAVGWNPVWIATFEPWVMSEALSGALLIGVVWAISVKPPAMVRDCLIALVTLLAALVGPRLLVSAVPIVGYLLWRQRAHAVAVGAILVLSAAPLIFLVINNGLRYQYWGLNSVGGSTLLSHANDHPEGIREPIRSEVDRHHAYLRGGTYLPYAMAKDGGRNYLEACAAAGAAARMFIVDHPIWYLQSVAAATVDSFSPPYRMVGVENNVLRTIAPWLWRVVAAAAAALMFIGAAALALPVAAPVRLSAAIYVISGFGTSLTAHTENMRFGLLLAPLALMAGVAAIRTLLALRSGRDAGSPASSAPSRRMAGASASIA